MAGHAAPPPASADDHHATNVSFDWPETDPASGMMCKPGHYVGEYACRLYIVQTSGPGAFDVSGSVDMQLEQTSDGELLRIANGHFSSDTLAAIPVAADIVGELHCATSKFDGMLENGTFSVALDLPVPFTQGTFSGPLSADYDKSAAQMLNGQWNMTGELDLVPGSCMNGSWSAHWVAN
jgi:hypothetical protein